MSEFNIYAREKVYGVEDRMKRKSRLLKVKVEGGQDQVVGAINNQEYMKKFIENETFLPAMLPVFAVFNGFKVDQPEPDMGEAA